LLQVQQQVSTPYVVLSGTVRPGQSRDARSGYATVTGDDPLDDGGAGAAGGSGLTSVIGGGATPLVGNAKVEAMLGLSEKRKGRDDGARSMMPPPPKMRKG
jgi:U4/U6.U5 tri-snRNP-associated protein 1